MATKVILISDFNEKAWALEDTLVHFTGAEVTWMTARNLNPDLLRNLSADILIIDTMQFDLSCVINLRDDTPVILLVDSLDDIFAQVDIHDCVVALQKGSSPSQILSVFETLKSQRLTRLGLRSSPSLSLDSRR